MRSTPDLIAELDEERSKHMFVGIVIGFETAPPIFVWADEGTAADRLRLLNDAVRVGGEPLGLAALDLSGLKSRAYPEHVNWAEADEYLGKLVDKAGELMLTQFGKKETRSASVNSLNLDEENPRSRS